MQKNKTGSVPCTKLNATQIKGLNIRPVSLNLLEGNIWNMLQFIGTGKGFLSFISGTGVMINH